MKKCAWTIAEMIIAMTVMIILSGICVNMFKPNSQKAKFYMYSAVTNITKANIAVIEKNNGLITDRVSKEDGTAEDSYCNSVADFLSLQSIPNCSTSAAETDINIQFPNKIAFYGMASDWITPEGATYKYKNIMIDIDGEEGLNKVGADRFPMRVLAGSGKGTEGMVIPVDCNENEETKNPYCGDSNKNFATDDQILVFNIYRAMDDSENSKVSLIASSLSHMEADCMAHGGEGVYSAEECSDAKIKVNQSCATSSICDKCTTDTLPDGAADKEGCKTVANDYNGSGLSCVYTRHKPKASMALIFDALIGDTDEL